MLPKSPLKNHQTFNSGYLMIARTVNVAPPGSMPQMEPVPVYEHVPYDKRVLGVIRAYMSEQEGARIDRVVRIQNRYKIDRTMQVVIKGDVFEIKEIKDVDETDVPAIEIELRRWNGGT